MDLQAIFNLHADQFMKMGLPVSLQVKALEKIIDSCYDCSSNLTIGLIRSSSDDEEEESNKELIQYEISASQDLEPEQDVYLIDNWFTFPLRRFGKMLEKDLLLLDRVEQLIGISPLGGGDEGSEKNGHCEKHEMKPVDERIEQVYDHMWKFVGSYSMQTNTNTVDTSVETKEEAMEPVWYFMDHYGTHIGRSIDSDETNVRIAPLIFIPTMASYSLMWITKPIGEGEALIQQHTYALKSESSLLRSVQMLPWTGMPDFEEEPPLHEPNWSEVALHRSENLPIIDEQELPLHFYPEDKVITVYTENQHVKSTLNSKHFRLIEPLSETGDSSNGDSATSTGEKPSAIDIKADVLFLLEHFKDFNRLREMNKFVNQFPGEHVMVCKDLLAATLRKISGDYFEQPDDKPVYPPWFQKTYNLYYELPRFVHDWEKRVENPDGPDMNLWILKPWNMSRGIGTYVTNNLDQIIRMCESDLPLIAQKYIERPLLFFREDLDCFVKFDMRILLAVQSVKPLLAFAYNQLWIRMGNIEYQLKNFFEYERHFSVMSYVLGVSFAHSMKYEVFRKKMETFYPNLNWDQVITDSHLAIRQILEASVNQGLYQLPNSRALYAIDLMVKYTDDNELQPVILESNFAPDIGTFIKPQYYPNFYNEVFELLFLNKWSEDKFTQI